VIRQLHKKIYDYFYVYYYFFLVIVVIVIFNIIFINYVFITIR